MKKRLALLAFATAVFAVPAALAQSTATFNFNNSGELTTYFNADSDPQWTYNATGGLAGSGGLTFPEDTNDLWISKGGFQVAAGNTYTLSVYYKNEFNSGYGGMGFTILTGSGHDNADSYAAPLEAIGISAHGGGYVVTNNTSTIGTAIGDSWYANATTNTLYGGDLPGDEVNTHWLYFSETISFVSGTSFTLQMNVYDVNQSTGAVGSLLAQTAAYSLTNADLAGSSALYPYFSTNGRRFTAADGLSIASTAAGVNLTDPSAPVPEPSTYALLAGVAGLGLALYRRRAARA
ncbi:MAG: PEP-CTERM sorting domain-containing protein [Verrucomicrobia bacterium]|nr:PEP-CTERM sorting domain-containing protein [Verrucomicrobiota bacterium]